MKVYLGGTWNKSTWRNRIIPMLKIDFFNPVVEDWTPDWIEKELNQRETCDFVLYVITPKMTETYSIAEVVDDSNKRPKATILVRLRHDDTESFNEAQWKSLNAVAQLVANNGGSAFTSLESASSFINKMGLK